MRTDQLPYPVVIFPPVKYELSGLEAWLEKIHAPSPGPNHPATLIKELKTEVTRIRRAFIFDGLTLVNNQSLTRYIQFHQETLIALMNKTATLSHTPARTIQRNLANACYRHLEDLLQFLERHFARDVNLDAIPPIVYTTRVKKESQILWLRFYDALLNRQADPQLIDSTLCIFRKIAKASTQSITYRKILYLHELQKELTALLKKPLPILKINDELRQIIQYLNYNSEQVLTYYSVYIHALMNQTNTPSGKIEHLSRLQKEINQTRVKPDFQYNPNAPALKARLTQYISEEINYLEKVSSLLPPGEQNRLPKNFKLKTQASVSQVAYLLRIMIETRLLLNDNVSEIMSLLVMVLTTPKTESISFSSIRSKYYDIETGTKKSVRKILLQIIHHIDNHLS